MHRRTQLILGYGACWLAACSAASGSTQAPRDGGSQAQDAAPAAQLDAASVRDAGDLEPAFECDAGPRAPSPDAIFFRAKHACERAMPALFGQCGRFHLSFDENGRASDLTLDESFGSLSDEYVACILNELADETYGCLSAKTIDPYDSCTIM